MPSWSLFCDFDWPQLNSNQVEHEFLAGIICKRVNGAWVFSVSWPARHRRPQNSKFKKIATIR